MYYGVYPYLGITEHIHVFWILNMYITELILVLRNLYLCTGLILVLQILYLCYRTESCISDLILLRRYP